jgi:hypothetical protein
MSVAFCIKNQFLIFASAFLCQSDTPLGLANLSVFKYISAFLTTTIENRRYFCQNYMVWANQQNSDKKASKRTFFIQSGNHWVY